MVHKSLYEGTAPYYDLIYAYKNYANEVQRINQYISEYKKSEGNDLLDIGCGTGEHIKFLKEKYKCVGIDPNQWMLNVARKKLPDIEFIQQDMIQLKLNKKFDVILCLFTAINHAMTLDDLKLTFKNMEQHLKPGGIILLEPAKIKEEPEYKPFMSTYTSDNLKIAKVSVKSIKKGLLTCDLHHLIGKTNQPVEHIVETLRFQIYNEDTIINAMEEQGIRARYVDKPIDDIYSGFILGVKDGFSNIWGSVLNI